MKTPGKMEEPQPTLGDKYDYEVIGEIVGLIKDNLPEAGGTQEVPSLALVVLKRTTRVTVAHTHRVA